MFENKNAQMNFRVSKRKFSKKWFQWRPTSDIFTRLDTKGPKIITIWYLIIVNSYHLMWLNTLATHACTFIEWHKCLQSVTATACKKYVGNMYTWSRPCVTSFTASTWNCMLVSPFVNFVTQSQPSHPPTTWWLVCPVLCLQAITTCTVSDVECNSV